MIVLAGQVRLSLARVTAGAVRGALARPGDHVGLGPMLYNVAQLLKDPVGSTRDDQIDEELRAPDEPWECTQVTGKVRLLRTHRGVLVTGDLTASVGAICGWCLEPVDLPLDLHIEEEYFPQIDIATGLPVAAPEDADAFFIDKHHILDLSEGIRQAIVLGMPISPRCREDCRGLCPVCGANLNERSCACERQTDARWATLGQLAHQWGASDRA